MKTQHRTISTEWTFRQDYSPELAEYLKLPWLHAAVPGHVHCDLEANGVITDPFYGLGEVNQGWIDQESWIYKTEFKIDSLLPGAAWLRFLGVDTFAEIELNGQALGRAENMFVPHEFPVNGVLKTGVNTLQVTFRSAWRVGNLRLEEWSNVHPGQAPERHWERWNARSLVRKAQYMFGWDWGPVFTSCGLWRPVELVHVPVARIVSWNHTVALKDGNAEITVCVEVEAPEPSVEPLRCRAQLADRATGEVFAFEESSVDPGSGQAPLTLAVQNPILWQPNGAPGVSAGSVAHLYDLTLELTAGETVVDELSAAVGLRTIELIREDDPDGAGQSFQFRVNGRDTFIKGANWIPADSFPSRLENEPHALENPRDTRVERLLKQAQGCGINMLRVWGGGFYESEHFYEWCDRLGILVWQDFPYACAYYPDDDAHAQIAKAEAEAAVRRIRNHPSLALWCGNNENQWMMATTDNPSTDPFLGNRLYESTLRDVVAALDPATPYWPGTPFGGADANSADFGDRHNWDVWHGRGDWRFYTEDNCRFSSEFGFASACGMAAWESCLAEDQRAPGSLAVRWHDKTRKGYDAYLGLVELHFAKAESLDDLVYTTQINQAEALAYGVEHYRRNIGRCWGTIIWQFDDCWPVHSWAIVDSLLEPKAAYWRLQRSHAPLLLSVWHAEGVVNATVVNETGRNVAAGLRLQICTFAGEVVERHSFEVELADNCAAKVAAVGLENARGMLDQCFALAQLTSRTGELLSETMLLLDEPKNCRLDDPEISIEVLEFGSRSATLSLQAKRFAAYVWLRLGGKQGWFDDNFFHLAPAIAKTIKVTDMDGLGSQSELLDDLQVRWLTRQESSMFNQENGNL